MPQAGSTGCQSCSKKEITRETEVKRIVAFPDSLSFEQGALIEPVSVAVYSKGMYPQNDYEQAIEWVANGSVITEPLVTGHFPFEQYAPVAFNLIAYSLKC